MKLIITVEIDDAFIAEEGMTREQMLKQIEEIKREAVKEAPQGITATLEILE